MVILQQNMQNIEQQVKSYILQARRKQIKSGGGASF